MRLSTTCSCTSSLWSSTILPFQEKGRDAEYLSLRSLPSIGCWRGGAICASGPLTLFTPPYPRALYLTTMEGQSVTGEHAGCGGLWISQSTLWRRREIPQQWY